MMGSNKGSKWGQTKGDPRIPINLKMFLEKHAEDLIAAIIKDLIEHGYKIIPPDASAPPHEDEIEDLAFSLHYCSHPARLKIIPEMIPVIEAARRYAAQKKDQP